MQWAFPSKQYIFLSILSLSFLWLCGCSQDQREIEPKRLSREQTIIYRLKWLFNASTAGDLWAQKKGIFKEKGLKVILKEGGAEQDAIEEIELGRANFGVASADQVLRAVSRGADVLVLAQIFQINPLQWIYIKNRVNLDKIPISKALKNLTIGITFGGNDEAIFWALARKLGLNPKKLKIYAITYDYSPFWQGKVDLWPCYKNTQGILLREKIELMGQKAGFLDPARYGVNFVANSLITSKEFAKKHPKTVLKFKNAVIEGWKQALDKKNIDEMAKILSDFDKTVPLKTIKKQLQITKDLVTANGIKDIGSIDKQAWIETEKEMFIQGLIKKHINIMLLFEHN